MHLDSEPAPARRQHRPTRCRRTTGDGGDQPRPADLAPQPRLQRARQPHAQRQCRGRPAVGLRHADDDRRGRELVAGRPPELHHQLDPRGRAADHQPARRSGARHAGLAHLRLHHRRRRCSSTAITGGNPDLQADRRNVFKLGGNWQPFAKTDLRLRADYRPPDDRPADLEHHASRRRSRRRSPIASSRDSVSGQLVSVDLRPVNFDSSRRTRCASASISPSR